MKDKKKISKFRYVLTGILLVVLYFFQMWLIKGENKFQYTIQYLVMLGLIILAFKFKFDKLLIRFYMSAFEIIANTVGSFSDDTSNSYGGSNSSQDGYSDRKPSYATKSSRDTTFGYNQKGEITIIGQKVGDTTYYRDNHGKTVATCVDMGEGIVCVRDDCGREIARGVRMGTSICYYTNDGKKIGSETELGGYLNFK